MTFFPALAALALSTLVSCAPASGQAPIATIENGVVIGTATKVPGAASATVVNKFLGVPFAASPTRFAPPATATAWTKPFNASRYGDTCPQSFVYPQQARTFDMKLFDDPPPLGGQSEDCLNLNIYVPATATKNKTVMVWIYGGAFAFGSNALPLYDGTSFAANQDVILIAINYRTNVFGFPVSNLIPTNETNLGLLDQHFALQWIQRNVQAFGGSPDKVLIFGESAGAVSVDALLLTNPANPPFRAAIAESGTAAGFTAGLAAKGMSGQSSTKAWDTLVKNLTCTGDVLACVQKASTSEILNIVQHEGLVFDPVIDNLTLPAEPEKLRLAGQVARVPYMTGSNANDGRPFVYGMNNATSYMETTWGFNASVAEGVESLYPIPSLYINDSFTQLAQIYTDFTFQCPAAVISNDTHIAGLPAYRYLYNATFSNMEPASELGVWHSSEIALVFGTYPQEGSTREQQLLSKYMQTSWANFAKDPTAGPGWASYPTMAILGPIPSSKGYNGVGTRYDVSMTGPLGKLVDKNCPAWDKLYLKLGFF